jgi:hopanoid C-3 methylase
MKLLCVHPGPLMYTRVFLRLEPLGLELVAAGARKAGHDVRLLDLQVETHHDYFRMLRNFHPDAVCYSGNYLANVPEIIDLARATRAQYPDIFIFVGGHSASFVARDILEHAECAIDCVFRGEGEAAIADLLDASRGNLTCVAGTVTRDGEGPPPRFVERLDSLRPARDLLRIRNKYFIGPLDPCASIEFARGCPWDCTFCSAWTFYGRSYRTSDPQFIADELARLREPGVFIVDDVAFVHAEHGMAIADAIERRGIRKEYYLETRADVLLRNREVFRRWRGLGLRYIFLGLEAIDAERLKLFRKRVSLDDSFAALEFARSLDVNVAINIIADPAWDRERFAAVRAWCMEIPEIVNISVTTPYPGTEIWPQQQAQLTTRDYRLFDIQHAVLPTTLPLDAFYKELVTTQQVLSRKHLGWAGIRGALGLAAKRLVKGQTNFVTSLWKFNSVYNARQQLADHALPVKYELPRSDPAAMPTDKRALYIHQPPARQPRALDEATARFVDKTRSA